MQIDVETIRWVISGFFFIAGVLISYAINRTVKSVDDKVSEQNRLISEAHSRLNVIERDYVKSDELDRTFELYLAPINVTLQAINNKLNKMP